MCETLTQVTLADSNLLPNSSRNTVDTNHHNDITYIFSGRFAHFWKRGEHPSRRANALEVASRFFALSLFDGLFWARSASKSLKKAALAL